MKRIVAILSVLLPSTLRRHVLRMVLGYELHPTSYIGLSLVLPKRLVMGPGSRISHLNVCKGLDLIDMAENAAIGRLNWISGFPAPSKPGQHFQQETERRSELIIGANAGITNRHLIDCTNTVTLGPFSNVGGFRCQLMTHSVEIVEGRQGSAPITLGAYSLVGTACVLLGGASLPEYSVLSASSLLNKRFDEPYMLYGGVPAKPIKSIPKEAGYFTRQTGFIV